MKEDEVYRHLKDVLSDVINNKNITITAETTAFDIKGWDSLAHIKIMLAIETKFDIQFEPSELLPKNVGALVASIINKV